MNTLAGTKRKTVDQYLAGGGGLSIRQIERLTGIHRDTIMRRKHEITFVEQRSDGVCRAMGQKKRIELWGKEIPEGQRLGWTCAVAYCGNPEHFALAENGRAGWRSYKEERARIIALKDGESVDFADEPNDERSVLKFRTSLLAPMGWDHFLVRTLPTGGVRVVRAGNYYQPKKEFHELCPVLKHKVAKAKNTIGSVYLGQFWGCWDDGAPRLPRCKVPACSYPQNGNGQGLCRHHFHFFDVDKIDRNTCEVRHEDWTELGKYQLDRRDLCPTAENPHPLYHTGMLWEDKYGWQKVRVVKEGDYIAATRAERLSEQWWKENVERVIGSQAEPPKPGTPGQAHGDAGRKGYGKKKIRKVQRKRAAQVGWHGSHPDQKPKDRFTREQLDRLPIFSAVRKVPKVALEEEPIIDEFEVDLEEREELAASIPDNFSFDDMETMEAPDSFSWDK